MLRPPPMSILSRAGLIAMLTAVGGAVHAQQRAPNAEEFAVVAEREKGQAARWQSALSSQFKYQPPAVVETNDNILPDHPPQKVNSSEPDPDIVHMETFVVNESAFDFQLLDSALRGQIADAKIQKRVDNIRKTVGIGMHTYEKGHFGAAAITVFHVPVFVAAGFSW